MTAKHERGVRVMWDEAMKRPVSKYSKEHWTQLAIARLFAKSEGVNLEVVDDDGVGGSRKNSISTAMDAEPMTKFESDIIANDLRRYGFTGFERQVSPFDNGEGGNLLKIQFAWKDKKVALEVYGPTQFLSPSQDLDGSIKARTRLL